jgi:hypothetical protein
MYVGPGYETHCTGKVLTVFGTVGTTVSAVIVIGWLKVHGFGKTTMIIFRATEKVWIG